MTLQHENTSLVDEALKLRVLLVDDDRDDSVIFSRLIRHLRNYRFDFSWTSDFDNALSLIQNQDFHIHFVDYRLGPRCGLDLISEGLRANPRKSFVMVTGVGNEAIAADSIRLGAVDYIAKADLTEQQLLRCIHNCIDSAAERTRRFEQLHIAKFDGLTGVYRREAFMAAAIEHMRADTEVESPRNLLFVDIDHFKQVNDQQGHLAGDAVLHEVADAIGACLRKRDLVGRFGGDEFCILSRGGDRSTALALGERIRETVAGRTGVTVSVGVVQGGQSADLKTLIERADSVMYKAKQNGRNRVEIWRE
jgi:two-component system, cell cycle response regulator